MVLEKILESPLARRSSQYILKEISPEYSLERLMLKLNLQYFGPLIGSQETPEVTGKFGIGVQNEVGQRLIEF